MLHNGSDKKRTGGTPTFGDKTNQDYFISRKMKPSKSYVDLGDPDSKENSIMHSKRLIPRTSPIKKTQNDEGELIKCRDRSRSPIASKTSRRTPNKLMSGTSRDLGPSITSTTRDNKQIPTTRDLTASVRLVNSKPAMTSRDLTSSVVPTSRDTKPVTNH